MNDNEYLRMHGMLRKLGLCLAALAWLSTAWASTGLSTDDSPYGFPVTDNFMATVVGTPEADQKAFPADSG